MALGLPTNFSYSLSKSLNDPKNKKFVDFTRKNQQKQKADKLRQQQAIDRVGQDKYNQGWVKFGNDKLNINTTSAKGLEKGIGVIARFIIKVQGKVNEIFYGKFTSGRESRNLIKRLLNKGIIKLLEGIASIDLCDILNYAISQIPAGKLFDPNNRPNSDDSLALKKWYVQKAAFDTQKFIDDYYRDYLDNNNPQSKVGLFVLIQNIKQTLGDTVLSPTSGINDPLLRKNFPQLGNANNFLQNGFSLIDRYTDVRQINNDNIVFLFKH
jgi:hypothetical protein